MEEKRFVVLMGQYRGGSTLLLRIINAHARGLLRGENFGLVEKLLRLRDHTLALPKDDYQSRIQSERWFPAIWNNIDRAAINAGMRRFLVGLVAPEADAHFAGYKEIRHGLPTSVPLSSLIVAIDEIFAGNARFLVLTRNVEEMVASILRCPWNQNRDCAAHHARLCEQQRNFNTAVREFPHLVAALDYRDLLHATEKLIEALQLIGIKFDVAAWKSAVTVRVAH